MDHSQRVGDEHEAMVRMEGGLGSKADQGQKSWIRPRHWNDCVGGDPSDMKMKTKTRKGTFQ